jgi:protein SCO1/2
MNESAKSRNLLVLSAFAALSLAACSGPSEAPPLEGASIGGPFALTDQNARQVRDSDFQGKYRIVYFGFASCPDVCPVDLQQIGQAMRALEKEDAGKAAKVQPIFITVDPERDTPAVLKDYVSAFHPRLIGLTGTPEQIAKVAKAYGIYYAKSGGEGGAGYSVDHNRLIYLFGPSGEPIALLPHDKGADEMARELKRWVA